MSTVMKRIIGCLIVVLLLFGMIRCMVCSVGSYQYNCEVTLLDKTTFNYSVYVKGIWIASCDEYNPLRDWPNTHSSRYREIIHNGRQYPASLIKYITLLGCKQVE